MALSDSFQQLKDFDFTDLDFDSIGVWPLPVRVLLLIVVFSLVLAGTYYFHVKDLGVQLEQSKAQEVKLKNNFEQKAFQAANLEAYRIQMAEVEKLFSALLAQLPSDTEVPGLLEDITEIGHGASLNISSITLQPERSAEFYVELPIKIVAEGGYHDVGAFVSGVAGLPRIVTLHDYSLSAKGSGGLLALEIQAKTYRYKTQED
ncbi:type 4a pilus biogenesis protein PilO [Porticoccus sp.]|uniref:type 4a pilus biogenesis protein PilO n=1 Tax=Porticoccus sp. TaxID=2024853 RepID=UPI000C3B02E4|nr:type 4a pilus biogenesis protein PilO [Porticoccus sp.]MAZ69365.1 pilus assembly protein PilP [Porticoccus sp.]|tara:strand:- start:7226 stop:7837 length:612 start_codon:yes stop_codon:yes gene_type:complete